jgi:hypothetical protein
MPFVRARRAAGLEAPGFILGLGDRGLCRGASRGLSGRSPLAAINLARFFNVRRWTGVPLRFSSHLAGEHQKHHALISPSGKQGMLEGSGHIAFDEKMREPRQSICKQERS